MFGSEGGDVMSEIAGVVSADLGELEFGHLSKVGLNAGGNSVGGSRSRVGIFCQVEWRVASPYE